MRRADGSAGDADYGLIGGGYTRFRRPDERIAALIHGALGSARLVLNVGAGTGSYEPTDREVVAIEPSAAMRAQRPAHLSPAIDGVAESLPFEDKYFDAGMALYTVHQWSQLAVGLAEMRRVTRGPVVVMTADPNEVQQFWLNAYAPQVLAAEAKRCPAIETIAQDLGGVIEVWPIPIPLDCKDGFNEAYYGRPERFLDESARLACSSWSFVDPSVADASVDQLRHGLEDGSWGMRYGHFRSQPEYLGSLRLVISR